MPFTESRLRLSIHLPSRSREHRKAISAFQTYLLAQQDTILRISGYTQTEGLVGQWWSPRHVAWIEDNITVIVTDIKGDESDDNFIQAIRDLKNYAHECYEAAGAYQDEIWITTQSLIRYCSDEQACSDPSN